MRTSHKLTQLILVVSAALLLGATCLGADPGVPYPNNSPVSDQKAGSILVFNYYTSSLTGGSGNNRQNSRFSVTNTHATISAYLHIFFVAETCSVADYHACLTPNQTATWLVSDYDPAISGYIVVMAENRLGWPFSHNFLVGDEFVKLPSGLNANLAAEAISAQFEGDLPVFNPNASSVAVTFSGETGGYDRLPATLAASNISSLVDQNETTLVLNRVGGDMLSSTLPLGTLFGLLYNDVESPYSFSLTGGACQRRVTLSDSEPRTTPRFSIVIPSGRTGWLKLYSINGNIGMLGSMLTVNPNTATRPGVFSGGHNLHKLTLTTEPVSMTIPVFPPACIL